MGEYILCAAYWFPDEETPVHNAKNITKGVVLCGHRHHNVIGQFNAMTGKRVPEVEHEDGFLTSENRFVGREEAMDIAETAGQTCRKASSKLDSYDLY